jgi:hypothetical protein
MGLFTDKELNDEQSKMTFFLRGLERRFGKKVILRV